MQAVLDELRKEEETRGKFLLRFAIFHKGIGTVITREDSDRSEKEAGFCRSYALQRKERVKGDRMKIKIPYGRGFLEEEIEDGRISGVIQSKADSFLPEHGERELIRKAMENPIGSPSLKELARGCKKIVIITSDHTRPVPSKLILPEILGDIREVNPEGDITILVATGCHRETNKRELKEKLGEEIYHNEKILIHHCDNSPMVYLGKLSSGNELAVNQIAAEADLLIAEGFIEPHFFAGYSGGRKSILPGVASRQSIYQNHRAEFIASEKSRCGIVEGNPIHEDMVEAAKKAGLRYIVNVVLNSRHKVIGAFAGDMEEAHKAGMEFLDSLCRAESEKADIVITSNNGYPLDQNLYQTVKGMAAAELICKKGGVIIMCGACEDGIGGDGFKSLFEEEKDLQAIAERIENSSETGIEPEQWQTQILVRILLNFHVILVSECQKEEVEIFHMSAAGSLGQALRMAQEYLDHEQGNIVVIPEGIASIVAEKIVE